MGWPAEALSVLCNGGDKGYNPSVTLSWFVCLSVTIATGDLFCLWNRIYSPVGKGLEASADLQCAWSNDMGEVLDCMHTCRAEILFSQWCLLSFEMGSKIDIFHPL